MKNLFSLLNIALFILAATLATPSSACEYDINHAFNLNLEGMEAMPIQTAYLGGGRGLVYIKIRMQNKSDCNFDNVKVIYTLRTPDYDVMSSGELDAGNFGPYETKTEEYRVKELAASTNIKGVTCDLSLKM